MQLKDGEQAWRALGWAAGVPQASNRVGTRELNYPSREEI